MSREILLLVDALAREKNVAKDIVFSALETALASATKKRIHDDADAVPASTRSPSRTATSSTRPPTGAAARTRSGASMRP